MITTAQREALYKHCIKLGAPELLAETIAMNSTSIYHGRTLFTIVGSTFIWRKTELGTKFWSALYESLDTQDCND